MIDQEISEKVKECQERPGNVSRKVWKGQDWGRLKNPP